MKSQNRHGGQNKQPFGTRTLGSFLTDQLFDNTKKMSNTTSSGVSSPTSASPPSSAVPSLGDHSKMLVTAGHKADEKKRRRGQRKQRKQPEYPVSNSDESAPSEDTGDDKQKVLNDFKDDYWYYDVATDGYYYEQNGAKGWRRRMPNGLKGKQPQMVPGQEQYQAPAPMKPGQQVPTTGAPGTTVNPIQLLQQAALFTQPAMKYYDPNSDGYFYEMASVDGWRKRQPTRPGPALPQRPAPAQSYGAALARGQMPAKYIDSSAASSGMDDQKLQLQELMLQTLADLSLDTINLARPSQLPSLAKRELLTGFNPDKFIEEICFQDAKGIDMSRTPVTPVKTSSSTLVTPMKTSSAFTTAPQPAGRLPAMPSLWSGWDGLEKSDDVLGTGLLQDLQKIWQSPTPTGVTN